MITWFARHTSQLLVTLSLMLTVAACGGGGGGGGDGGFLPDPGSLFVVDLELTDPFGNPTDTVTATTPATLTVTVTEDRRPAEGIVVTAETDIGVVLPLLSGTALTNSDGIAQFRMESADVVGAGTITASVTVDGETTEGTLTFQVLRPTLRLGYFDGDVFIEGELNLTPDQLTSGGASLVEVAIVDENNERTTTKEVVRLNSGCASDGDAQLPAEVETSNGLATATYTASGCEGEDEIVATLVDGFSTASATLTVAPPEVGSLNFLSAEPELIALKGTGGPGRQETSDVTFITIDGQGTPIQGVLVEFDLSTEIGGLSLAESSAITNEEGLAVAVVQSGNVATPVRVIATVDLGDGDSASTISDALVVSTGLPDSNSISLSSSVLNVPGALDFDGRTASLTVRMADKFNNPVADGTSVLFTTEYGSIESTCIITNGACSVTWTSQDPRFPTFNQDLVRTIYDSDYSCPDHRGSSGPCPSDLGGIRGLRSTVSVIALGEEFFVDSNGNGLYDEGEPFENLPEAFRDHNEDGVYTPTVGPQCPPPTSTERCIAGGAEEEFFDFNEDGEYNLNVYPPEFPDGFYNGSLCPPEGDGIFCSKELLVVSDSLVLVLSSSTSFNTLVVAESGQVIGSEVSEGAKYRAYVSDLYNNRPAGGTTINISTKGDCKLLSEGSYQVADSNAPGAFGGGGERIAIQIEGDGGEGTMSVTVNPPGGSPSVQSYDCSTTPDEEPAASSGLSLGGG